ncbi:MAG: hypothetical protein AB7H90_04075 [Alphaproteobacteria bacterium]
MQRAWTIIESTIGYSKSGFSLGGVGKHKYLDNTPACRISTPEQDRFVHPSFFNGRKPLLDGSGASATGRWRAVETATATTLRGIALPMRLDFRRGVDNARPDRELAKTWVREFF